MNYIEQVNRFWSIDLEANFSHLEVHLFFKLLDINNKLGWKESFRFPNSRLEAEIGSRPKNLINARQRLVDLGLISYKKGTTRSSGTYSLIANYFQNGVTKESNQESNQTDDFQKDPTKESNQESNQTDDFQIDLTKESNKESNQGNNGKVIRGSLNKLNKTKQDLINNRDYKKLRLSELENSDFDNPLYFQITVSFWELFKKNYQDSGISTNQLLRANGKWVDHVRLLFESDGYSKEDMRTVFKFLQHDTFWKTNIVSTDKLRKQFDKLLMQAKTRVNGNSKKGNPATSDAELVEVLSKHFD